MIDRNIEFIVKGVVTGEPGRYMVIGRCGDEPIRVGDVFSCLFRYKKGTYPQDAEHPSKREGEQRPIDVRVRGLQAYDKDLNELGPGMTGSIWLEGQGVQQVQPGMVLGIPCPACKA